MQQSLHHLYLVTIIEHLLSKHYGDSNTLPDLVTMACKIQEQMKISGETIVLQIELQAVIQVILQQLAMYFNPTISHKLSDVQFILQDINKLVL